MLNDALCFVHSAYCVKIHFSFRSQRKTFHYEFMYEMPRIYTHFSLKKGKQKIPKTRPISLEQRVEQACELSWFAINYNFILAIFVFGFLASIVQRKVDVDRARKNKTKWQNEIENNNFS